MALSMIKTKIMQELRPFLLDIMCFYICVVGKYVLEQKRRKKVMCCRDTHIRTHLWVVSGTYVQVDTIISFREKYSESLEDTKFFLRVMKATCRA